LDTPEYKGDAAFYVMRVKHDPIDTQKEEDPFKCDGIFFPTHVTRRISSQLGLFSIQQDPRVELKWGMITKYTIPFAARNELRQEIELYGINRGFIFADIDHIAADLQLRLTS
jgi:type I restriction enzyme M protein